MKTEPLQDLAENSTSRNGPPERPAGIESYTLDKSILEQFSGPLTPARTSPLYKAGLAVVAFAMVLLPLIYIGLIALAVWGVLFHLSHNLWLLNGRGGGLFKLIAYLGPAVVGGILVFFMVKPFFAKKGKAPTPLTLDPREEPLLFEFVNKVCRLVGARTPCRIDVDCQVNASAGLKKGLWSNDLVLTIGMPLAAGLSVREFAGVLAHEFGHFSQGAGMRLTYVIRNINFWFARVVYERDAWDQKLEALARGSDFRIAIVLHGARGCVWLTRRILWALMHAGHAISCFMLRQMEFDADSYEAKLAGSDTYESTSTRIRMLNAASQQAYEDVRQSWSSKRLPVNLPLLVGLKWTGLSPEIQKKISEGAAQEKTGWFDTHPCDSDRIKAARKLSEKGVFRLETPATGLFRNFPQLSEKVTLHHYKQNLEIEFTESNLMSTEEMIAESTENTTAAQVVQEFFGTVNISHAPLLTPPELDLACDRSTAIAEWKEARRKAGDLKPAAEKLSKECADELQKLINYTSAMYLSRAKFKIKAEEFGLPRITGGIDVHEIKAEKAARDSSLRMTDLILQLQPFMIALRRRVALALWFAVQQEEGPQDSGKRPTTRELMKILSALGAELQILHDMGCKFSAFGILGQNRGNHSDPAIVDETARTIVNELEKVIAGMDQRLNAYPYPFAHARSPLSIAKFAESETPAQNDFQRVFENTNTHLERLFSLHYKVLGKLLSKAHEAEKLMEAEGA